MKLTRPLIGTTGILLILALLVPAALAAEVVTTSQQVLSEAPPEPAPRGGLRNDAAGPMFDLPAMRPGDRVERCIRVFLEDVSVEEAELFLRAEVGGNGLAEYLDLTVETGLGGDSSSCDGFAPTARIFDGTLAGLGNQDQGAPAALPADGQLTYRLAITLRDDPGAQGLSTTLDLTWEIRG